MTVEKFISKIQGSYGTYSAGQLTVVKQYLEKQKPALIEYLYAEVLKTVSWQYKTPPGPKEFEQAMKNVKVRPELRIELQPAPVLKLDEPEVPAEEAKKFFDELKRVTSKKKPEGRVIDYAERKAQLQRQAVTLQDKAASMR